MINVAINGFGRIGRLVLRAAMNDPAINIVAINDLTDPKTLSHLLKYDTVHGRFPGAVAAKEKSIVINGKEIKITADKDPEKLPWGSLGIDVVAECTGYFLTKELATKHIKAGARKVLLSAPPKSDRGSGIKTLVKGVNDQTYSGEEIVSNASCTTNCFAPMAKILEDNYGIVDGVMTTVHSYTNDQSVLDAPHKDLRRARAAAANIVPTSTGAAKAIGEVIPSLDGKILGAAVRVPTPDGSLCHFIAEVSRDKKMYTPSEVNELFKKYADGQMNGILEYCNEPIVSSDIIGNAHSCVFDSMLTECIGNNIIIVGWYDNEFGYSNRMVDVMKIITKK